MSDQPEQVQPTQEAATLTPQEKKWYQQSQEDIVALQKKRVEEALQRGGNGYVQQLFSDATRWLADNTPLKPDRTFPIKMEQPSSDVPGGIIHSTGYLPRADDFYVMIAQDTLAEEALKILHPEAGQDERNQMVREEISAFREQNNAPPANPTSNL